MVFSLYLRFVCVILLLHLLAMFSGVNPRALRIKTKYSVLTLSLQWIKFTV